MSFILSHELAKLKFKYSKRHLMIIPIILSIGLFTLIRSLNHGSASRDIFIYLMFAPFVLIIPLFFFIRIFFMHRLYYADKLALQATQNLPAAESALKRMAAELSDFNCGDDISTSPIIQKRINHLHRVAGEIGLL